MVKFRLTRQRSQRPAGRNAGGYVAAATRFGWLIILLVMCLRPVLVSAQERIDLATRHGATQPIYFTAARNPVASAILFPGRFGVVRQERNNFLVRVAGAFAAAGISAAVADAPSDHSGGMDTGFRAGEAQATDTAAIVAFLQARAAVPVWLVGTSRGSISAANAAVRLGPPRIAGVVLTSSVWASGISAVPLAALRVPVLIVHNRDDTCRASPFDQAAPVLATLSAAPAKQFIAVAGGLLRGEPCGGKSPHGYWGIESQVVALVVAWIKAH